MKKQTQTKKRQNRSRSHSKKYNKKSNLIGGTGMNNIVEQPAAIPRPIFFNGNHYRVFELLEAGRERQLGEYKLNYMMVNHDTGMVDEYLFKNLNNNHILRLTPEQRRRDYRFEMTLNEYPDAEANNNN